MEILKMLDCVYNFQKTFKCVQAERLSLLLEKDRKRRFALQKEEWDEYKLAVRHNNKTEMLDAIVDGVYICLGTILAHGYKNFTEHESKSKSTESLDLILFNMKDSYISGNLTSSEILHYHKTIFESLIHLFEEGVNKGYWTSNFIDIFLEVHNSNMSKLDENGNPIFRADGKVLKGLNFVKPDIKKFIL